MTNFQRRVICNRYRA